MAYLEEKNIQLSGHIDHYKMKGSKYDDRANRLRQSKAQADEDAQCTIKKQQRGLDEAKDSIKYLRNANKKKEEQMVMWNQEFKAVRE